ncbi:MAG: FtsX-like permease family protein [Rhodanobacteraceae bacterium]|nr:MAG: FtsX-like permease family protein [Rhodanobacteraceae bacterium]
MKVWLAEIWRSWRASFRRPGFPLLAIGVLALGVGATVAVFTLIDDTLLQPLPVPQPARLVALGPLQGGQVQAVTPRQYQHMTGVDGLVSLGIEQSGPTVNIAGGRGEPKLVHVTYADRGLLPTLGIQPLLGRNFSAQEDSPHGPPVVILNYGFWQRRFGGDRNVVGRTLEVDGRAHTIVGVLPKNYAALGFAGDIMLPMALPPNDQDDGANQIAIGRLSGSASIPVVSAELNARLHAMYVKLDNPWVKARFGAEDYKASLHDGDRPVLVLFLVSALFVLAIALVNLTNLMLFRALSRSHDAAVRNALGAPLLRQVLPAMAEGLLIGLGGALLGLLLAFVGLYFLQGFIPDDWLNGASLHFGALAWGLAFVVGVLGTLLAAGLGLWRSRSAGTVEELRAGGRSGISRSSHRLGRILVVLQVVLATGLLCAVGLFLHTLYGAEQTPLGFSAGNTLTFEMSPLKTAYPDAAAVDQLAKSLTRHLETIPGVISATATTNLPASGDPLGQFNVSMQTPSGQYFDPQYHGVGLGFFHQFGIHLHEGRLFTADDVRGGEKIAIVDQALADRYYGGHAVGQMIQNGWPAHPWAARIVGVVDTTYQMGALNGPALVVYVPLAQMPNSYLQGLFSFEPMRFALQVRGNPYSYRDAVQHAVSLLAPNQPVANFRSMQDVVASTTAPLRLNLMLVGIFAVLALLLAGVGLYAVMSVAVAAREHEFGVRTALGATPRALLRLVLREGLMQTGIGLVLGVILALALSIAMGSVVEAMGSTRVIDPPSIIGACVVLAIAGLLACALPALRAARVPPMRALRGE